MKTLNQQALAHYTGLNAQQHFDKEDQQAACWNWALFGMPAHKVPDPSVMFGYVDRGLIGPATRKHNEGVLEANEGGLWHAFQKGQPWRTKLDAIRAAYDGDADTEARRNQVRDELFELVLQAAGFTLSAQATPYRICMFEPKDVVMWDHWWVEVNGAVVETIPGNALYAYSNRYLAPAFCHPRNRFGLRASAGGLSANQQLRAHARYVTALQDEQAGYLEILQAVH